MKTAMEATSGFGETTVTVNSGIPGTISASLQMNINDHPPELQEQEINGVWTWVLAVDLELYVANGTSSMANLRTAIENILAKVDSNQTWSGNATLTNVQLTEKEIEHNEYQQAITVVQLTIQFDTTDFAI